MRRQAPASRDEIESAAGRLVTAAIEQLDGRTDGALATIPSLDRGRRLLPRQIQVAQSAPQDWL